MGIRFAGRYWSTPSVCSNVIDLPIPGKPVSPITFIFPSVEDDLTVTLIDRDTSAPMQAKGRTATGVALVELVGSDGSDQSRHNPPITYTNVTGSPFTLVANTWTKVATVTASTRALWISSIPTATVYDIQWTVVPAGAAAPADTYGIGILAYENFQTGAPIGDIYIKSPTSNQVAVVKVGN